MAGSLRARSSGGASRSRDEALAASGPMMSRRTQSTMGPVPSGLSPRERDRLARKGELLYGKSCGTGGRGACAESFAVHQLRLGRVEVVDDLLRFLDVRIDALLRGRSPRAAAGDRSAGGVHSTAPGRSVIRLATQIQQAPDANYPALPHGGGRERLESTSSITEPLERAVFQGDVKLEHAARRVRPSSVIAVTSAVIPVSRTRSPSLNGLRSLPKELIGDPVQIAVPGWMTIVVGSVGRMETTGRPGARTRTCRGIGEPLSSRRS